MFCGVGLSALVGGAVRRQPDRRAPRAADPGALGAAAARPGRSSGTTRWSTPRCPSPCWCGGLLFFTRWGLALRAVGENPAAAFAAGRSPSAVQYQALLIAGLLAGIAGAHLSLGLARTWAEWMTAGRGFIAVALVIFAKWHPLRAVAGALLFGGAISLELQIQALGVPVSPFLLDMLPYLLSLAVLMRVGRPRAATPRRPAWAGSSSERGVSGASRVHGGRECAGSIDHAAARTVADAHGGGAAALLALPLGRDAAAQSPKLKVGILHVGSINDAGYNQAHAEGIRP